MIFIRDDQTPILMTSCVSGAGCSASADPVFHILVWWHNFIIKCIVDTVKNADRWGSVVHVWCVPASHTGKGERPASFSELELLSPLRNSQGMENLGRKHEKENIYIKKKTDSFSFLLPSKSTDSYQNSPGKNCMVGALSWIFLLILKERSGSSLPSLLMHSPASNDTPSMSSDTSRTFRTSTGATAKRQEHWVGMIMAWIFRYFSSQPSRHLNYSSFRLKSDTPMMHAFYHNRTPACTAVCSAASVEWQTFDTVKSHVGKWENVCIATPSFIF